MTGVILAAVLGAVGAIAVVLIETVSDLDTRVSVLEVKFRYHELRQHGGPGGR